MWHTGLRLKREKNGSACAAQAPLCTATRSLSPLPQGAGALGPSRVPRLAAEEAAGRVAIASVSMLPVAPGNSPGMPHAKANDGGRSACKAVQQIWQHSPACQVGCA